MHLIPLPSTQKGASLNGVHIALVSFADFNRTKTGLFCNHMERAKFTL
jgi:hypothetical protein